MSPHNFSPGLNESFVCLFVSFTSTYSLCRVEQEKIVQFASQCQEKQRHPCRGSSSTRVALLSLMTSKSKFIVTPQGSLLDNVYHKNAKYSCNVL